LLNGSSSAVSTKVQVDFEFIDVSALLSIAGILRKERMEEVLLISYSAPASRLTELAEAIEARQKLILKSL
jgi:hypothetical protein